jgi:nitroreductase
LAGDLTPDQLLSTTRAVRRRLDLGRPVSLAVIDECLRLAIQAPTGGNSQDWRWLVVADGQLRRDVAEIYRSASMEGFRAALETATDPGARKAYEGAIQLGEVLQDVPILVIPCLAGRIEEPTHHRAAGFFGSIVPAIWSFQLALRSRGLGSTYTTAHLREEEAMAALLGIPANVAQIALIPVAYTIGSRFNPAARLPLSEVARLDTWDGRWPM